MKTLKVVAVTLFALVSEAFAQNGFTPMFDNPVEFAQVHDDYAWMKGHWVGKDMAGASSSEISCDKKEGTCRDTQANISVIGGMFDMTGDVAEYAVQRWNKTEIVAVIDGRAPCYLRQVLKIDRAAKRVTWMAVLSEPLDPSLPEMTAKLCTLGQMNLELKDGTAWSMKVGR